MRQRLHCDKNANQKGAGAKRVRRLLRDVIRHECFYTWIYNYYSIYSVEFFTSISTLIKWSFESFE